MSIFKLEDFNFSYDKDKNALTNLNLEIIENSITAIIGGNGAGKSTFLLSLNGINQPNHGRLLFKDKEVKYKKKDLIELRQKVGVVFQNPDDQLFLDDGIKDISFGLKNLKVPDEEIDILIKDVIKRLELDEFVKKPIHSLSFGQKKKIALAGVLVMKPEVIILDEPTAGLDPKGITDLFNLIFDLKEERDLTILISTHDLDLVSLYCDQSVVINKGHIDFNGTTDDLIMQPNLLRANHLRLPRIAHLMEILDTKDSIEVDRHVATISQARKQIKKLIGEDNE